jgi:TRAP-type C4-dicarboxylate transport system permease small subunit
MTRVVAAAARLLSHVAAIALIGMVLMNVADVGLRSMFNTPIFGTYEIVEFLLAAVAFLVIPEAFLRGNHITVELIDQLVSARMVALLKATGMAATVAYLMVLVWAMVQPALDMVQFNDVSFNLHMPKIWEGSFVLAGLAASAVAAAYVFWRDVLDAVRGGNSP